MVFSVFLIDNKPYDETKINNVLVRLSILSDFPTLFEALTSSPLVPSEDVNLYKQLKIYNFIFEKGSLYS